MTKTDFMGYEIVADGVDAGRYATAEVAAQVYCEDLYSYISDASKDARGFRHRMDISGMTFADLQAECDYWEKQVEISIEEDRIEQELAIANFKALVARTIELGAKDEETALRWLIQDETFYSVQCVEHYVWEQGLLCTDYGRELGNKLKSIVTYKEVA